MNRIIFPLKMGMNGQAVADLQDGLRLLLEKGVIPLDDADRQAFAERLHAERAEQHYDEGSAKLVALFQAQQQLPTSGDVDEATAKALNDAIAVLQPQQRIVQGQVRTTDGRPVVGVVVRAYNKGLRNETLLGETRTDPTGRYIIMYDVALPAEKSSVNLYVCVFAQDEKEIANSAIRFNAPHEVVMDLITPNAEVLLSEYERYLADLTPLLTGQGTAINLGDLSENDIDFVAGATGIQRQHVAWLTLSAQRSRETITLGPPLGPHGIRLLIPLFADQLFYAWFRQELPTDLPALFAHSPEVLQRALYASIDANIVPGVLRPAVGHIIGEQLPTWLAREALKPAPSGSVSSLGDLLATMGAAEKLNEVEQLQFARLHREAGGTDRLWEQAEARSLVAKFPSLRRTMLLNDIAKAHRPLLTALQSLHDPAAPESVAYLGKISHKAWLELAFTHGVPPGSTMSPVDYALALEQTVEDRFPAVVLCERLRSGAIVLNDFPNEQIVQLLSAHPDFDIRTEKADAFLARVGANRPELGKALRTVQRVLHIADQSHIAEQIPTSARLLNKGFDSAYAIARIGREHFVAELGDEINEQSLRNIHAAAQAVTVNLLALTARFSPRFNARAIAAIPPATASAAFLTQHPNLRVLFGDLDYCECRHCQSVLGPAAYLTDLLHFLEDTLVKSQGGQPAYAALLKRRPDIAYLDLSCENTNTEIPYIDLVLEVLENAVALPRAIPIDREGAEEIKSALEEGPVPPRIRTALARTAITISDNLQAVRRASTPIPFLPISEWSITDGSRNWTVTYMPKVLFDRSAKTRTVWHAFEQVDEVEAALKRGKLHPDLIRYLVGENPMPPLVWQTVEEAKPLGWEVTLAQALWLEIKPGAQLVTILVWESGNLPPKELVISLAGAQQVEAWLQGDVPSRIALAVLDILELPHLAYERILDPATGRWIVGAKQTHTLWISTEELNVSALTYQNSSIRADLAAVPENRNPAAYEELRNAVFPWTLPLDLWSEEIRVYLQELGISRRRLMEIAWPQDRSRNAYLHELTGYSQPDFSKIQDPWRLWGLLEKDNSIQDTLAGERRTGSWIEVLQHVSMVMQQSGLTYRQLLDLLQTSSGGDAKPSIEREVGCQPTLMLFRSLDKEQLDWVYDFTHQWRKLGWSMRELDRALVALRGFKVTEGLAQVQRLRERLQQPILSLTAMLGYLETQSWIEHTTDGTPISPSLYDAVFRRNVLRPSNSFGLFELSVDASELKYLDHAVGTPPPQALKLSEHVDFLAAALGLQPDAISRLLDPKSTLGILDQLILENLTTLYGIASFCYSLRMSIDEFIRWIALFKLNPFTKPNANERAAALLSFAENYAFAKQEGASLDELDYLLRHESHGTFKEMQNRLLTGLTEFRGALQGGAVLGNISLTNLIVQLRKAGVTEALAAALSSDAAMAALFKAEIEFDQAPTPLPTIPDSLTNHFYYIAGAAQSGRLECYGMITDQTEFSELPDELRPWGAILKARYELVRDILLSQLQLFPVPVFVAQTATPTPAPLLPNDMGAFLSYDQSNRLQLTGFITQAQADALKEILPALETQLQELAEQSIDLVSRQDVLEKTIALELLSTKADSAIRTVLIRLVPCLEVDLVKAQLGAWLELDPLLTESLLQTVQVEVAGVAKTVKTAYALLTDEALLSSDGKSPLDEGLFDVQIRALCRLDKAARLLRGKGITQEQLEWFTERAFQVTDFNDLPTTGGEPKLDFSAWRAFQQVLRFRNGVENGAVTTQKLVETCKRPTATAQDIYVLFAEAYQLPVSEIEQVCGLGLLNLQWPSDFHNPERLLHLVEFLHVLKLLGTGVSTLGAMIEETPIAKDAMAARKLFMSRFDAKTLPERLQPISDKLRIMQRDALVSYLVAQNRESLPDANALLDYYLIDVKMEPCMRTSRIKQAISSVQLFVQRCLLNLERALISPQDIDSTHWRWMKNYRVWEANRKIFLYPENWIEPELRDDKSEIFRQLESDLLQENLTYAAGVDAFKGYLERATKIAKLTVVALWEEPLKDWQNREAGKVVHIVAKDAGKPTQHYYRQLTLKGGTPAWTPWEQIDGEIDSQHVFVFKLGGFLHIAYADIKPDESNTKWKVGMVVRRKTREGWTITKKSSKEDEILHPMVPNKDEITSFVFRLSALDETNDTIQFDCFGAKPPAGWISSPEIGDLDIIDAYDVDAWQYLNADIRVLEKITDGRKISFFAPTKQPITMVMAMDWYLTVKDMNDKNIVHLTFGYRKFDDGVVQLRCTESEELITKYFPELYLLFKNNEKITSHLHCRSLSVQTAGIAYRHRESSKKFEIDLTSMKTGKLKRDIVLEVLDTYDDLPEISPERELQFDWIGAFSLDTYLSFSPTLEKKVDLPPKPSNCQYYCSGYRSDALSSPMNWDGNLALTSTQGRYFITTTDSGSVWAFSDTRFSLYFLKGEIGYRVLPDGQDWITTGLRQLSRQDQLTIDLEQLPMSLSGGNATTSTPTKIPWDAATCTAIDAQTSAKELVLAFNSTWPASVYDWEAFFHTPLLIATQLSKAQRFEEAQRWFHTIFDPTTNDSGRLFTMDLKYQSDLNRGVLSPALRDEFQNHHIEFSSDAQVKIAQEVPNSRWTIDVNGSPRYFVVNDGKVLHICDESIRYWRFPPFRAAARGKSIDQVLALFAQGKRNSTEEDLSSEIEAWKDNPFNPHLVARFRIRSYQWAVVIQYIDNLIAWGDQLFRRDTIESINEATQLYILAARLLGPRPASNPKRKRAALSYLELRKQQIDQFSNAWVELEDLVGSQLAGTSDPLAIKVMRDPLKDLYFCVPSNEAIEVLWDTVDDRLFKIRHCMNVDGVERRLPLFEPPIDPALLVKATAAGLDLADVLADLTTSLPLYRFNVMLQKALELCAEVKALGGALLSALEKKDAEALALLRSSHERELLKKTKEIRKQQIEEASLTLEGLHESRKTAEERFKHYQLLLGRSEIAVPQPGQVVSLEPVPLNLAKSGLDAQAMGLGISQTEKDQLSQLGTSQDLMLAVGIAHAAATGAFLVGINPFAAPIAQSIGHALGSGASTLSTFSGYYSALAGRDAIIGGYERRRDEWIFQGNMALRELQQIDKQIAAAEIRKAISEKELDNLQLQIENAQALDEFMHSKYTNQELYRWMSTQLSSIYFRTYQLAYELAKRAERCFQFELGITSSSFISFGYWDSLHKGLLAGEQLHHDLKRLDIAYLERNKREYEITKHVSLLQLDPVALIALRQTGRCDIAIPETLFDLDCPGHFMRRIKSVSLSVPCVTGPYTGIHCTLTLLTSGVRQMARGSYDKPSPEDLRFDYTSIHSIVTSSGQNDSGLFETNLRDERYLPFEGAGAISTWRLELPSEFRQFDYDTIADVILHIRYTAREGGNLLRKAAVDHLTEIIQDAQNSGCMRLFSLRNEFPTEWNRFTTIAAGKGDQCLFSIDSKFVNELNESKLTQELHEVFQAQGKQLTNQAKVTVKQPGSEWSIDDKDPKYFICNENQMLKVYAAVYSQTFGLGKERFPFLFQGRTITVTAVDLYGIPKTDLAADQAPNLNVLKVTSPDGTVVPLQDGTPIGQLLHRLTAELDIDVENMKKNAATDWKFEVAQTSVPESLDRLEDILILCHYQVGEQK